MPLLACTITAEARAILHAAGGLALLPLFATAEMRAHIDLRALTNLHMGKLSVNIGLTLEYATALKNLDAALKAEYPAFVELMDEAAASYVPIIMDVVQDAMALYSSKVPMGTAAGVGGRWLRLPCEQVDASSIESRMWPAAQMEAKRARPCGCGFEAARTSSTPRTRLRSPRSMQRVPRPCMLAILLDRCARWHSLSSSAAPPIHAPECP
jgi:hypothetical protein